VGVPTSAHFIFIPFVLLMGVIIGWILGGRAQRDAAAAAEQAEKARAERKAQRAAARGKKSADADDSTADDATSPRS